MQSREALLDRLQDGAEVDVLIVGGAANGNAIAPIAHARIVDSAAAGTERGVIATADCADSTLCKRTVRIPAERGQSRQQEFPNVVRRRSLLERRRARVRS